MRLERLQNLSEILFCISLLIIISAKEGGYETVSGSLCLSLS